jgi:predicted nicotinamide N-methyase
MVDPGYRDAVLASTKLRPTPFVPEVVLHCADDAYSVWTATATTTSGARDESAPMPFWSFPWAGGQALARYVLDNRDLVIGRRVLDLAAGSGLVAIAAAMAGASDVTANDIDPCASAAQELNAQANGVRIRTLTADILDADTDADVILAGDVCYEREFADRMVAFLRRASSRGADVLLGDPGRAYLPRETLDEVTSYDVPTSLALEDHTTKRTTIWRPQTLDGARRRNG